MFRSKNHHHFILGVGLVLCVHFYSLAVKIGVRYEQKGVRAGIVSDKFRIKLQQIYSAEVGVRETTGHNDGPRVQEYLQYVHLGGNFSYCAAFACWSMGKAGIFNPKNGWAPALFPQKRVIWARDHPIGLPQTGDVFGIYFSELKRIAHCGFVDRWDGTWCVTIEANTSNPIRAGPSQQGVYRKKRLVKTIYQVADWISP